MLITKDKFALEREEEERAQKELWNQEMQESSEKAAYIQEVFGDLMSGKQIIDSPDVTVTHKKHNENEVVYQVAEAELMKMRNNGDVDYKRLETILSKLK